MATDSNGLSTASKSWSVRPPGVTSRAPDRGRNNHIQLTTGETDLRCRIQASCLGGNATQGITHFEQHIVSTKPRIHNEEPFSDNLGVFGHSTTKGGTRFQARLGLE